MNQAKKYKITTNILVIILMVIMVGGYLIHKELKHEMDQLKSEKLAETRNWVHMQFMYTYSLDVDLANILASNSASYRKKYLADAHESASYMAHSHWFYPAPTILNHFQLNLVEPFWRQTANYLGYLLHDGGETLTKLQLQNLLKMRDYTLKTVPVMRQLKDNVMYGPHVDEVPSEEMSRLIATLTAKLDSNPTIGDKDKSFNDYQYSLYPYKPAQVLVFKNEKRVHKEELQTKVKSFMNLVWKDEKDNQVTSSGGGGHRSLGIASGSGPAMARRCFMK
ncbi:hypothetical protein [Paenibacillus montanisoli]|uniref:Uncharacterized protein n=1 Tax=Paenibacillus montanisoli TaxID=2081970 RepID=A0A328U4I2_9BACL|nr:hypothetical protein [Paenibacillus montanisoli]RAP75815.1 hypothetical protein DL346_10260 [Paenibacillus montanisoli]